MHVTQHHRIFTPQPKQLLSPTRHWRPLTHWYPRVLEILHTTFWVLHACIIFIQRLDFKNGDTISGFRTLKIHFGHRHRHHSAWVLLLWQTEYFHHCAVVSGVTSRFCIVNVGSLLRLPLANISASYKAVNFKMFFCADSHCYSSLLFPVINLFLSFEKYNTKNTTRIKHVYTTRWYNMYNTL